MSITLKSNDNQESKISKEEEKNKEKNDLLKIKVKKLLSKLELYK